MQLDFRKNLSNKDRIIRVIIGLVLLGMMAARIINGWWALVAGILAVSQFVEALLGY